MRSGERSGESVFYGFLFVVLAVTLIFVAVGRMAYLEYDFNYQIDRTVIEQRTYRRIERAQSERQRRDLYLNCLGYGQLPDRQVCKVFVLNELREGNRSLSYYMGWLQR